MPKTLLLADDSVTIQKVVGISLANEDIELVTVENGDDAVTQAQEVRPDIVLADIVMPGKNGYEVCEAIKTDPNLGSTPVLLLTGTFEAFDAERARQVGADGHITKPFEAQALVDQVNQLLARSTPLGDESASATSPPKPRPQAAASAPTADVGAHGEGGDAFDFFEGEEGSDSSGDLMGDSGPRAYSGQAEETVLLDPGQGSGDPAFDAAVEAAAFDAPGIRSSFQEPDDSGFDLESADLSMANTVPEVPVAPASVSQPPEPARPAQPAAPAAAREAAPAAAREAAPAATPEAAPVTDPLLDFDPLGETDPTTPVQSFDDTSVQSFDDDEVQTFDDTSHAFDAEGEELHVEAIDLAGTTAGGATETMLVVEDANPVRVQSPADAAAAPVATPVATPGGASELSPAVQQHLHATLEKIAWEAFSDISEQVVKQVLAKVEAVAWEVIPRMAEVLVKEEIERMKGVPEEE